MPIQVMVPGTDHPTEILVDAFQFLQIMYLGVFVGPVVPVLPYLVTSIAAGDDTVLQGMAPLLMIDGGISLGAMFTYFCQDEVPFSPEKETNAALIRTDIAEPIAGENWISLGDQTYLICRMWKLEPADAVEAEAVASDEPLLILTGAFDPITPPENGELVKASFPNGQLVEFTAQGHDPASTDPECANPIITSFLDNPTVPVEAACAADPIEFLPPGDLLSPLATPVASPVPGV
jgi:pimeloyl-ACP methyl ester carboxylesterase